MSDADFDFSFKNLFSPLTNAKAITWIIIIGLVVYANMLFNGFVWDDRTFILMNPDVTHLDIFYLFGPNTFNNISAGQYRPLIAVYFTILHTIFDNSTFFYHIFQLTINITNTILLFYILKKFFNINIAFLVVLVFLFHPIQVESVSYIASSDNPIFTFFGLSALLLNSIDNPTWKKTLLVFCLLLCSLLSKETGLLFVILTVVYRYLFLKTNKTAYLCYGILTIIIYLFFRFAVADVYFSIVKLAPIARLSLADRFFTMPAVIFYYLKTFFSPINLVIIQYWTVTSADFSHFYLPLMLDLFSFLLIVFTGRYVWERGRKTFKQFMFFCLWLFLGLGMYSQIYPLDMTVADRWFYFPIIGLLGIFACVFQEFQVVLAKHKTVVLTCAILLLCVFAIRTIVRNNNWQNAITLYTHDSSIIDNFELENSLGGELNVVGDYEQALPHFQKSVEMFPHETNLFNLGLVYDEKGDVKDAEKYYADAYYIPSYGIATYPHKRLEAIYIEYATILLQHNPSKALTVVNDGLIDYPNDTSEWYIKVECEYKLGNHADAVTAAAKIVQLLPNNGTAINLYNRLINNQAISITN